MAETRPLTACPGGGRGHAVDPGCDEGRAYFPDV